MAERGFAAFYVTVLIMIVVFALAVSIFILTYNQQKTIQNIIRSSQAYYLAEAGIEDALLRLKNDSEQAGFSYSFNLSGGSATTTVSNIIGGSRTVIAEGDVKDRIRKTQIIYRVTTEEISFYYGAQIGDGGMEMGNNSKVEGNVFSNGSVIAPAGVADIEGTIIVAGNGNRIEGLDILLDAKVHTCKDSTIGGNLTYVSGGSVQNCTAGGLIDSQPNDILPKDLSIGQSTIDNWKAEAEGGGTIVGDYNLDGGTTAPLGLRKITGSLTIDNNSTLIMTGTIWVQGDITITNGSTIRLDSASFGGLSGVLIADGKIKIRPGVSLEGSGIEGSYLVLISTNNSLDKALPAIEVDNTTSGGIFYTPNNYAGGNGGLIVIRNNVEARQVTGYKIYLEQNAVVDYEYGLVDAQFSSGPGGSWEVASWREIE